MHPRLAQMDDEERAAFYAQALASPPSTNPTQLRDGKRIGRNDPCPCGSGSKYKKCHGAPKRETPRTLPKTVSMKDLFNEEQQEASKQFLRQYGFQPNPTQLQVFMEGDEDECKRMVKMAVKRANEAAGGGELPADNKFAYAIDKLNMLVTPMNKPLLTDEEKQTYTEALQEWQREHGEPVAREPGGAESVATGETARSAAD